MTDDETIALRVTVIGGQRYPDDFTVIVRASGVSSDKVQWSWNCYLHGRPSLGNESGTRRQPLRLQGPVPDGMVAHPRRAHRCGHREGAAIPEASANALAR